MALSKPTLKAPKFKWREILETAKNVCEPLRCVENMRENTHMVDLTIEGTTNGVQEILDTVRPEDLNYDTEIKLKVTTRHQINSIVKHKMKFYNYARLETFLRPDAMSKYIECKGSPPLVMMANEFAYAKEVYKEFYSFDLKNGFFKGFISCLICNGCGMINDYFVSPRKFVFWLPFSACKYCRKMRVSIDYEDVSTFYNESELQWHDISKSDFIHIALTPTKK